MIKFRQKVFTIQEGHFTGSKDMDKIPGALAIVGKSALGGSIIGGVVGKFDKDATIMADALRGGKYGALAGIGFKLFLNHLHKSMTKIKYQDVDKMIRREFGIYKAAGLTIGDKISNKISVDEKFGFNDRKITDYKINISIQDNKICLYTFEMTNEELDKTSVILDYYCSKYFGMEYESRLINQRLNSYAVNIVFTNQQVVSNFIMELSERLNTKINILNSDAVVCNRLSEYMYEDEECVKFIEKLNPKYGIMVVGELGQIFIKKGAMFLHKEKLQERDKERIIARLSSENICLRQKLYDIRNELDIYKNILEGKKNGEEN